MDFQFIKSAEPQQQQHQPSDGGDNSSGVSQSDSDDNDDDADEPMPSLSPDLPIATPAAPAAAAQLQQPKKFVFRTPPSAVAPPTDDAATPVSPVTPPPQPLMHTPSAPIRVRRRRPPPPPSPVAAPPAAAALPPPQVTGMRWIWVAAFYGGFITVLLASLLFIAGAHFDMIRVTVPSSSRARGRPSSSSFVYPVRTERRHDTTSVPLRANNAAGPLLASLRSTFAAHASAGYPCLCMHHLLLPTTTSSLAPPQYRVCAVYDARFIDDDGAATMIVVNPRIIGHGNKSSVYEETSLSCGATATARSRYQTIFLEWDTATGDDLLYTKLDGLPAVCMQLAVEEMEGGSKHC